ncbi:MAG: hypothetical protein HY782_17640 [Chloroflexi bacterium]|nr:hypothetical protein [Chloroflexota bacterium]
MSRKHIGFFLLAGAMLAVIAFLAWPRPASAQCGSSASSCRNCHEVKKQYPVNTKGVWHTSHAFGDFCEFCHAGNVKAKDKAAAHTGLIGPLSDVKGSCNSCHPNDYVDRAKKFADTLGVEIGLGGAPARTIASASGTGEPAGDGIAPCGSGTNGGQIIDLNKIYAAGMNDVPPTNVGNIVLLVMIGATVFTFGGLAAHYEHPLERGMAAWRNLLATPAPAAAPSDTRPELAALAPLLAANDANTLRAVTQILSDRENGPKILQALGHLDLQTLAALGESDQKALTALLALTKEMTT